MRTTITAGRGRAWWRSQKVAEAIGSIAVHAILVAGLALVLFPLVWMISASLKPNSQIFTYPPKWIPWPALWSNYPKGLETLEFGMGLRNTLSIAVPSVIGQVLSCSLVGYGLARIQFKGRNVLFLLVLGTMMLPREVTLIPTFMVFNRLRLVDSFWPFWLPAWLATSGFNIFLLRQFFLTIPQEMDDAARIDGAGTFGIFGRIMLPLAKPAVVAVILFEFIRYWNDFLGPLIYLPSHTRRTLQLLLMNFKLLHGSDWGPMMAAQVVIAIPPLLIFFFGQKLFIQGVVFTGIKG